MSKTNQAEANGTNELRFLSVRDIQRMMNISRAGAYALVRKKDFPSISIGNRIVIPSDLFNEWVNRTAASGRC
jgi:predicted DNA-binding transcriptional regulator AlpA